MTAKIPFIWSNDGLAMGWAAKLERMLEFLTPYGIPGSFAVTPVKMEAARPRFFYEDEELRQAIRSGQADGHEFFQHGTTHEGIENGISDPRMYLLRNRSASYAVTRHRQFYDHYWSFEAIRAQIEWGRRAWIEGLGRAPEGFRPGGYCFCQNMYRALADLGFKWCSCDSVSMTGRLWSMGQWDYPVEFEPPYRPYKRYGEIMEIPSLDDVAYQPSASGRKRLLDLGKQYWQLCLAYQTPYVLCSQWCGLESENDEGYAIHRELLDFILNSGQADPMTLTQYYQKIEAGEYPLGEDGGRDWPDPPVWHVWYHQKPPS